MIASLLKRRDAECARHDFLRVHLPRPQAASNLAEAHLIRAGLHSARISQRKAAGLAGVTFEHLNRVLNGHRESKSLLSTIAKITELELADQRCREFAFKFTHRRTAAAAGTTQGEK